MGKNTRQKAGTILREFSSGGVVFKKVNGSILWFVAATVPSDLYPKVSWRLPKGWIDDSSEWGVPGPKASGKVKASEEDLQKTAIREVEEEGGMEAKIIEKVGSEKYFFRAPDRGNILKFVTFYLMEWAKDLPEGFGEETSEVLWLPYEKAYRKLSYGGEKKILKKAEEILSQGVQGGLPL